MKKVFITGGTGLIGEYTIPFLKEYGFDIYALTTQKRLNIDGMTYINGNLFDKIYIDSVLKEIRPEYLLHYAWLSTGHFDSNSNFDFLTSSIDLLKSFAKYGGKRVVMAGTYAEYGYREEILTENMDAEPINIYSQCKDFVRQITEAYCKHNNISFGWGRIFSAFGKEKDSRRLTLDVINHLRKGQIIIIRSGSLVRDYIYAKDIGHAFAKFLNSDVEGIVNICSGQGITIHEYVMKIAKMMEKEELVIFKEQKSQQQNRVIGSSARLNKEVGFLPAYSIECALEEILNIQNI